MNGRSTIVGLDDAGNWEIYRRWLTRRALLLARCTPGVMLRRATTDTCIATSCSRSRIATSRRLLWLLVQSRFDLFEDFVPLVAAKGPLAGG